MSKVINYEVMRFPATRLIGKQVNMSINPGPDNPAAALWQSMWQDGSMELLQSLPFLSTKDPDTVGWLGEFNLKDNTLVYIAGVLTKAGAEVPEGFVFRDLPECDMGIGWIQGREEDGDLYEGAHDKVFLAMKEKGYEYDYTTGTYEMQYYSYKRFGVPRYLGEKLLIMDYYSPCKKLQTESPNTEDEKALTVSEKSKMGKNFDNLANRIIYGYKCTFPDCLPVEEDDVSEVSQRQMHGFLQDVICSIYEAPSLINLQSEKDDFFENWEMMNNRPELINVMRKIEKTLLDFYTFLYNLGENSEVKDNKLYVSSTKMKLAKKRLMQLERFGLMNESNGDGTVFWCEKYPKLFPAWKLLCKNKLDSVKREIPRFIYCMYDASRYKAEHLFGNITGNSVLIRDLEDHFKEKGYHCSFDDYGIHWEKDYPDKQKGKGDFFFDWKRRDQMTYAFHVPSFRKILENFDKMENELKDPVFSRTKKCDGCGYCTQLDKTGKRKPLAMAIEYNGQKSRKCPLFPNLTWRYIDEKEVKVIKRLFDFSESALYGIQADHKDILENESELGINFFEGNSVQGLLDNEVSIVWIKPMRVLSSYTKESYIEDGFYYTSDAKGFYKWVDDNLPVSMPGSHEVFDFQNTFIKNYYQSAAMKKISDDFINTTPYVDYIFGGGLFAMIYAYEDESIGMQHNRLKDYIDNSEYYAIDYLPNGNQRHESLGEPVISPNTSRNRRAIYIPVKIRSDNTTKNKWSYDKYIGYPNIGRIEPSKENFDNLMNKLHRR